MKEKERADYIAKFCTPERWRELVRKLNTLFRSEDGVQEWKVGKEKVVIFQMSREERNRLSDLVSGFFYQERWAGMERAKTEGGRPGMAHCLKCAPRFFENIVSGKKRFEVRQNDRNYRVGDRITLSEWEGSRINESGQCVTEGYTGRVWQGQIVYVLSHADFVGVKEGWVVLGLDECIE